ncbi:MAG: hypothetical protein RSE33_16170 [Hafnia sp.]
MKQVTMESVKQRIDQIAKPLARGSVFRLSIKEEFELSCLHELVTVTEQLEVQHVRSNELAVQLANAESKCRELAAENTGLNKFIKSDCWIWDDKSEEYFDAADCMPETPTSDAFLAEVRAQGVDAAIEHLSKKFEGTGHIGVPVMALEWLAQELRKGAAQ